MIGRCVVVADILRQPCEGLQDVIGTKSIELRYLCVPNVGGDTVVGSFILLRRKFIVFWCPCCGTRIGTSTSVDRDDGISRTRQQLLTFHPRALIGPGHPSQSGQTTNGERP